jgi:hypothetical protein
MNMRQDKEAHGRRILTLRADHEPEFFRPRLQTKGFASAIA